MLFRMLLISAIGFFAVTAQAADDPSGTMTADQARLAHEREVTAAIAALSRPWFARARDRSCLSPWRSP